MVPRAWENIEAFSGGEIKTIKAKESSDYEEETIEDGQRKSGDLRCKGRECVRK